ncbi:hypothetical protein llh_12615 [Lactococcus cremoris subsp. cremoris A76]|nr:hypothetical protein llh_12615 [Lactococcus cremoris subsp. cremoris A76]
MKVASFQEIIADIFGFASNIDSRYATKVASRSRNQSCQ